MSETKKGSRNPNWFLLPFGLRSTLSLLQKTVGFRAEKLLHNFHPAFKGSPRLGRVRTGKFNIGQVIINAIGHFIAAIAYASPVNIRPGSFVVNFHAPAVINRKMHAPDKRRLPRPEGIVVAIVVRRNNVWQLQKETHLLADNVAF